MTSRANQREPVVITGIGMLTAVGRGREEVWQALQQGRDGMGWIRGLPGLGDHALVGAMVDWRETVPHRLKAISMALHAADEAVDDARLDLEALDGDRAGCFVAGHFGDSYGVEEALGLSPMQPRQGEAWWKQVLPNSACAALANRYGLNGPRMCHSVACASGLVSVLSATQALRRGQCDLALAGGSEMIHALLAAGFHNMRALAHDDDPAEACRPFDKQRKGFVMGEGAAMFVLERLSHAQRRGARIYAEIAGEKVLSQAHHVTGVDSESESLRDLIRLTLRDAGVGPRDIGYVNAHGTGTQQNDLAEMRAIRSAFGAAVQHTCVSSIKSMIGHLTNAAGCVELAVTALSLRDGFAPPTVNLTEPDPECAFDCLPLVGRVNRVQHALKLSVAFGGHLVGVVLSRWNDVATGFSYPFFVQRRAA